MKLSADERNKNTAKVLVLKWSQKHGDAFCNSGDTSHLESWNPPGDFRSRTSHDAIPRTPLPNELLRLTLVPLIRCSSMMETCLQDTTNLYSCHCVSIPSRLQICSNLYDFTIRPQKLRNFWEAGQNYTQAESHYVKLYLRSLRRGAWSPVACHYPTLQLGEYEALIGQTCTTWHL